MTEYTVFYYNQMDEIIQEIKTNHNEVLLQRFAENGEQIEYNTFQLNKERQGATIINSWEKYDKYGNPLKSISLLSESNGLLSEKISKTELKYDKIGNWILRKLYVNDSLTTLIERKIEYY